MGFYDTPSGTDFNDKIKHKGKRLFDMQFKNSPEGYIAKIYNSNGNTYEKEVIIQQHTNPLNERLQDKAMIYFNNENEPVEWGFVIEINTIKYIVITEPHSNEIYQSCKIRRLCNVVDFTVDSVEFKYDCLLNNTKLYEDASYVGDGNIFEDEDMRSVVLPYDKNTSKLKLFDYVVVDGEGFKVIYVDKIAMKRYGKEFGVLQIALVKNVFGIISCNDKEIIGVLRFCKLKERIYNSKARELITNHGVVNTGDYVVHTYNKDDAGGTETRHYMVYSEVDTKNTYDTTFCLLCDREINMLDNNGKIVTYRMYVNDNKSMLRQSSIGVIDGKDTSSTWASVKEDVNTFKLGKKIKRILVGRMLGGEKIYTAYKIIGRDDLALNGVIVLSVQGDEIHPKDDLVNGIAYNGEDSTDTISPTLEIKGESNLYFDIDSEYTIDNTTTYPTIWACTEPFVRFKYANGNKCAICVEYDRALMNKTIELKCTIDIATYTKTIKLIN